MSKDSILFHKKWGNVIKGLPDAVRLEIYDAIMEYGFSGKSSVLKPLAKVAFEFIKADIDEDKVILEEEEQAEEQVRAEKSEKMRQNAMRRWNKDNAETCKSMQLHANAYGGMQTHTDAYDSMQAHNLHKSAESSRTRIEDNQDKIKDLDIRDNNQEKETPYGGKEKEAAEDNDAALKGSAQNYTQTTQDSAQNGKAKKARPTLASTFDKRKTDFYNSLVPYVEEYGKEMIRAFFDYWSEANKSRTKMRCELEKTWEVKRRLVTWASRDNRFNTKNNGNTTENDKRRGTQATYHTAEEYEEDF